MSNNNTVYLGLISFAPLVFWYFIPFYINDLPQDDSSDRVDFHDSVEQDIRESYDEKECVSNDGRLNTMSISKIVLV